MRTMSRVGLVWLAVTLFGAEASAHILLVAPQPRYDDDAIKAGRQPCGGPRAQNRTAQLTAGDQLEVRWQETVEHPGHYELFFSEAGDAGWQEIDINIPDADARNGGDDYTFMWTVPNTPCTDCTLQLKQFMSGSQTYYFSCADISISSPGSNNGTTNNANNGSTNNEPGNNGSSNNGLPGFDPTLDTDGDTIPDVRDNCPGTVNVNQADGDRNGFGDACDPDGAVGGGGNTGGSTGGNDQSGGIDPSQDDEGCSTAGSTEPGGLWFLALLGLLFGRAIRRR